MSIDSIGNLLTIIRNGIKVSKPFVIAPYSQMNNAILQILKEEGFIKDAIIEEDGSVRKNLKIFLKYVDGESVIHELDRVSLPSRRNYSRSKEIKPIIGGLGVSIISTNLGLMTDKIAAKKGIGGEVICKVW